MGHNSIKNKEKIKKYKWPARILDGRPEVLMARNPNVQKSGWPEVLRPVIHKCRSPDADAMGQKS